MKVLRVLTLYLVVGTVLAWWVRWLGDMPDDEAYVNEFPVPAGSDATDITRYRDEAVAMVFANALGWFDTDPLVFERLVQNQRFVGHRTSDGATDEDLFAHALAMGMHYDDPVVRRRMVTRLNGLIEAQMPQPTAAELESFLDSHRSEWVVPEQRRFDTLFQNLKPRPRPSGSLLDVPPPLLRFGSESVLRRVWGGEFSTFVFRCPQDRWCGPVLSSYGVHWVKITEVIEPSVAAWTDRRGWVIEKMKAERRGPWARQQLDVLANRLSLVPIRVRGGDEI